MLSKTFIQALTVISLSYSATAHMIMANPVPYSKDKIDSGPITRSQFPCKANLGFDVSQENKMAAGEKQTLSFKGSAVHGGGSCQLVVTTDRPPTANSKFKVIQSIEGACPGVDSASTFDFTLPKEVPDGELTFAWTWFAKLSGAPEMYMNCAPITVSGGAKDASGLDSLPDMFVANLDGGAGCQTPVSQDTKFPDPGSDTVVNKGTFGELRGSCAAGGGGSNPPAGGSSVVSPAPAPTSAVGGGDGGGNGGGNNGMYTPDTPAATSEAPPNSAGGVFAPGASSAAPPATKTPSPAPAEPTATLTTLITVTGGTTPEPTAVTPTGGSPPDPVPSPPGSAPTPGAGGAGAICPTDGAMVCNGSTQWGLCDHGKVVWQAVAPGTTCTNGAIQAKKIKREGKPFARAHKRRFHGIDHNC